MSGLGGPKAYRIVDEPTPSKLGHLVVRPIFPLLGMMLGGFWLGLPWFVFNAFAVGSPTRWREVGVAIFGLLTCGLMIFAIFGLAPDSWTKLGINFAFLGVTLWKLGVGYVLQVTQGRSFEIYVHYGGPVRNGLLVAIAALWIEPVLLGGLPVWLRVVLG